MGRYRVVFENAEGAFISATFPNWRRFKRWQRMQGAGVTIIEKGVSPERADVLLSRHLRRMSQTRPQVAILGNPTPRFRDHRWFDGYDAHFPILWG
jgi:hypothetical protein